MRPELVVAYGQALYRILSPGGPVQLRVGMPAFESDAILAGLGCSRGAVVTAANPRSELLPQISNAERDERLLARLASMGLSPLRTQASDPAGHWPDEPGYFLPGVMPVVALQLARSFDQLAILWCEAGQPPRLSWTGIDPVATPHLDQQREHDGGQA
jgi:hypothetical protein